jgi:hypothetical protein
MNVYPTAAANKVLNPPKITKMMGNTKVEFQVFKFHQMAQELADLVTQKNEAYGDSFSKCADFLKILYPAGVPVDKFGDMLAMVRVFDKQMRIANRKDAFGEDPWRDIAGYGLLMSSDKEKSS